MTKVPKLTDSLFHHLVLEVNRNKKTHNKAGVKANRVTQIFDYYLESHIEYIVVFRAVVILNYYSIKTNTV